MFLSKRDADPRKNYSIIQEDGIQVEMLPQEEAGGGCTCFPVVFRKNLTDVTVRSGGCCWQLHGKLLGIWLLGIKRIARTNSK